MNLKNISDKAKEIIGDNINLKPSPFENAPDDFDTYKILINLFEEIFLTLIRTNLNGVFTYQSFLDLRTVLDEYKFTIDFDIRGYSFTVTEVELFEKIVFNYFLNSDKLFTPKETNEVLNVFKPQFEEVLRFCLNPLEDYSDTHLVVPEAFLIAFNKQPI